MNIPVRVLKLHEDAQLPRYGRPGDAGLDIHAHEGYTLAPGERHFFPTGIVIVIPEGTVGLVWDRSGLSSNHGIKTLAGVLDHTYRGEIRITLINLSQQAYEVKKGDRIAQLLVQPIFTAEIQEVDSLEETVRGSGGFGSSGR